MDISFSLSSNGVLNWIWGIICKFFLWLGSFWKYYVLIIAVLLLLYIIYKLLDQYLYNKFRGSYKS